MHEYLTFKIKLGEFAEFTLNHLRSKNIVQKYHTQQNVLKTKFGRKF
jgi:hypothetical protein